MQFINNYKKLEKTCNEIYNCKHGISVYIDEMHKHKDGYKYVSGWNQDLKQLKHYRWLRNKIVHDIDANEDELCKRGDEIWLNNFNKKLLNKTDPLSIYRQKKKNTNIKVIIILLVFIIVFVLLFTLLK